MRSASLEKKICKGEEEATEKDNDYQKIEKVLAPFLRTLKKKKNVKADVLPEEYKELYLRRDPKELLNRLQNSFTDPVGIRTLLNETAELLKTATSSKSANLYLADYSRDELLLCPRIIRNDDRFERRYFIEAGTYVAPYVALTREYVLSNDILGDSRFPLGIPHTGPSVKAVLCVPIMTNPQGSCIGVIELYRECSDKPYSMINLQVCTALTAWMGIAIEQNGLRLTLLKEMEIQNHLSQLAELFFSGVIPFNKAVADVIKITKGAVKAEKGAFFLFHETVPPNSVEPLLAEAYEEGLDENQETVLYKKKNKIRFVKNEPGIPGYVARSGEPINIYDAYKDARFDKKLDSPFFRTRSVLGFPIKNSHGVLAALKLTNSLESPHFRKEDVELVQSYLNYFALICEYYLLETACNKLRLKLVLTNKLLDFHMKPTFEEMAAMRAFVQGDQDLPKGFFNFDWDSSNFEDDAHKYIALAFMNSDILEPCFEFQNLADFLLRVRKSYRPVLYHNFEHAFCVFHCAYNIIGKNKSFFNPADAVTVLLVALCHDIDHNGLTNSFLSLKNDTVYKLYGDFCGEAQRHEVCMFLIQSTDLLSNVSSQNYQIITKNLKKLMLAFDMAIHLQNRRKINELLNWRTFSWENPEHVYFAQNMLLICSDYSANFKSFEVVKKFTSNFYKETYKQGDLEKSMGFLPLPLLDRSKIDYIPENQIILLTVICLPAVEIVVTLLPNLDILLELLNTTITKWREIISLRGQEMWKLNRALIKDKKEKRSHRVTLSSTLSSIRTILSESRSYR